MTNTKPTEPTSRHLSDADLGLDVIRDLRTEAAAAGDSEQVALCDRALDGDQDALAECYRVIDAAAAWWAWHDADPSRWSPGEGPDEATADAEERCAAWVRGDSTDGPES